MKGVLSSLLHLAYTLSLIVVFLVVTLNVTIPVSLQWPTYCNSICRKGVPLRDQCQSFCQLHEDTYTRVRAFSGITTKHMKSLLDKENRFLAPLLASPPGWFILVNTLLTISTIVSALFWMSTILGDAPAKFMKTPAKLAAYVSFSAYAAYFFAAFVASCASFIDFQAKINLYSRKELVLLEIMFACPLLQLLVIRNIPTAQRKTTRRRKS
ncbi:mannan endo-14-beta-mannosidase [Perkinsela sp. CCAP 1560/4]|nr:mannan endo-14-beta-mannosidase [Perkinsela sp. CCAP 1560/4]|eukprot:KNH06228.1 mannan endo-14-beta-mannosidase [Perkinsela sp. CCAP 1560/4]